MLLWRFCPAREEADKYILEVDPDDDIRENIINYDDEGAGTNNLNNYYSELRFLKTAKILKFQAFYLYSFGTL